jgi:hypothetical protein
VMVTWTEDAIRGLGVKTDVATAGSIFGLSRTQSYNAVKGGWFPVPVVPIGRTRLIVPTAPILKILRMGSPEKDVTGPVGLAAVSDQRASAGK